MNWEELKDYVTSAELAQSQFGIKFKARLVKEMLSDYKKLPVLWVCNTCCVGIWKAEEPYLANQSWSSWTVPTNILTSEESS